MKEIPLSNGGHTIVDDADFEWLSQWSWCLNNRGYVRRTTKTKGGKYLGIYMHRAILGLQQGDGKVTDHINGNPLDNRRSNLRVVNFSKNNQNRAKNKKPTSSQYTGVSWHKQVSKWTAAIRINRRLIYLGCFSDEKEAARAYDEAALTFYGKHARTNFQTVGSGV